MTSAVHEIDMRERPGGVVAILLLATAIGVAVSDADAASFNCARATLPAEKAICGNANLSSLDDRTAGMYFLIVGSGAPAPRSLK
jgi:uncharacterized protein